MAYKWIGKQDGFTIWEKKIIRRFIVSNVNIDVEIDLADFKSKQHLITKGRKYRITKAEAKRIVQRGCWETERSYFDGTQVVTKPIILSNSDYQLLEQIEFATLKETTLDPATLYVKDA